MDLSNLSNLANSATALSNLILVSPQKTVGYQPQNAPSFEKNTAKPPEAFLFSYEGDNEIELTSDITDHYIENNTVVNDQIALRPEVIRVTGYVGELNDIAPAALQPLQTAAEKLTVISGYTPELSTTALIAYQNAFFAYQVGKAVVDTAVNAWASVSGALSGSGGQGVSVINGAGIQSQPAQNKQQQMFQQFYGYWRNRQLFTVQTPWAIFQDCAIQSVRAVQDGETRVISSFEVAFKLLRFASTSLIRGKLDPGNFQSRASSAASGILNKGTTALTDNVAFSLG